MSSAAYTVGLKRSAQKEIRALDMSAQARIIQAIRGLASEQRPAGCRKLVGAENRWRIRVGDYRIIYTIDDAARGRDSCRATPQ